MRRARWFWFVRGFFMFLFFMLGFGLVVMLLWNTLMPELFGLPELRFVQALGLLVLARLLVGNFGGGFGPGKRHAYFKQRMHERWRNMTPEERERWKQEARHCCGSSYEEDEKEKEA